MLQPARRKYRKEQKGRDTYADKAVQWRLGDFGLKCTDRGRLTARQIEELHVVLFLVPVKHRHTSCWIRVFPDKPISQKPAEVRMGNGRQYSILRC